MSPARPRTITMLGLGRLYDRWCPKNTRLHCGSEWRNAHEVAHSILATRFEITRSGYALCEIGCCRCALLNPTPDRRTLNYCDLIEAAAMELSTSWHVAAGRPDLAVMEVNQTDNYDLYILPERTRARRLLTRRSLMDLPCSEAAIANYFTHALNRTPERQVRRTRRHRGGH